MFIKMFLNIIKIVLRLKKIQIYTISRGKLFNLIIGPITQSRNRIMSFDSKNTIHDDNIDHPETHDLPYIYISRGYYLKRSRMSRDNKEKDDRDLTRKDIADMCSFGLTKKKKKDPTLFEEEEAKKNGHKVLLDGWSYSVTCHPRNCVQ